MKLKIYLIKLIKFYQKILSPFKLFLKYLGFWGSNSCVFYPTCSQYTKEAIKKYEITYNFGMAQPITDEIGRIVMKSGQLPADPRLYTTK